MRPQTNSTVYSGTSGLVLPVPQSLYPPEFQGKSRLSYYASLLNSVEINSSFYKIPKITTISKWAESVPDDFQFTFKLPKAITHTKGLEFNGEYVNDFMDVIANIRIKKGCLLIQFPPALKMDKLHQLQKLLIRIKESNQNHLWKVAIEFRNQSWYHEEVYELLNQYKACRVVHDIPASAVSLTDFEFSFCYSGFMVLKVATVEVTRMSFYTNMHNILKHW